MQLGRFLPPTFRMLFVAMFVAAALITPIRISPQSSAPAAQPMTTTATSEAARPEEAKPKEATKADPNDVYLHSPTVQAIARMIHLDVETTARIFEGINFAIIVLAVGFLLFRILPKTLRNRTAKVRTNIESARKMTEDAYARLSAIEAKLSGLDSDIAQIRAQVEVESREDEKRIKSTIKEESARIVAAAEQEMEASAALARRSLRHFAAELAIEQAAKQMEITAETDRALIAEFLGDTAVKTAPRGGRK
ncbi:MAG TPA: ATP synthase F0 subunit B [Terracidiphilus sp.]